MIGWDARPLPDPQNLGGPTELLQYSPTQPYSSVQHVPMSSVYNVSQLSAEWHSHISVLISGKQLKHTLSPGRSVWVSGSISSTGKTVSKWCIQVSGMYTKILYKKHVKYTLTRQSKVKIDLKLISIVYRHRWSDTCSGFRPLRTGPAVTLHISRF